MIKKLLLVLWAFVMFSPYAMANCNCSQPSTDAIPPFLGSAVSIPPNVLIVMDISGSMSDDAYTGSYTGTEEGYFDPNAVYSYNQNGGYWYQSNSNASNCPPSSQNPDNSKSYSGSCLNYHYMRRIDVLKWVLTGGEPKHCSATSASDKNCDPRLNNMDINGDNIMLTTYKGEDVLTPMSRVKDSLLISLANNTQKTKPRIGLEMFSSVVDQKKVYIGDYDVSGNTDPNYPYTNLIRMISAAAPTGYTATGPAMKAALDYFNQGALDIGTDCKRQDYGYCEGN
jgi:type IV pilus assembly protein PilY1